MFSRDLLAFPRRTLGDGKILTRNSSRVGIYFEWNIKLMDYIFRASERVFIDFLFKHLNSPFHLSLQSRKSSGQLPASNLTPEMDPYKLRSPANQILRSLDGTEKNAS